MPRFSSFVLAASLCVIAAPAIAAKPRVSAEAAPRIPAPVTITDQQVIMPASGPYVVSLANLKGRVVVRRWPYNIVYVKATKFADHVLGDLEAGYFATVQAEVTHTPADTVAVKTTWRGQKDTFPAIQLNRTPHLSVDYTIMVPPKCVLTVSQEQGPITVVGVDGRVSASTRDGELSFAKLAGRAEATNERGDIRVSEVDGDAIAHSQRGNLTFTGVTGDVQAATSTGDVWISVSPRFAGDVSFHTVSGVFRSDLVTFNTDLEPGDKGYVGTLRGPLAKLDPPQVRFQLDTVSGSATVASERTAAF